MRELLLILGAACIASLPFVAFNAWFETAPRPETAALWSNDLHQASPAYTMPKVMAASAKIEQR
ncbi:MAG: hypothetical protein OJJ21_03855 [Ferrovibrio sp.]|uniref:hypothetical protein n=1 Tax=Ferrovibrio sp. TaxID=1917215 RepID=UPI002619FB38|nr:hypothetical protein [Ferrovibrio sp.]MCW0232714.1 hypothetical protein [Ferrovibrio sp.]